MNTEETIELSYERLGERISEKFRCKDIARDIVTLAGMAEIYCADHHDDGLRVPFRSKAVEAGVYPARKVPRLCPDCAMHVRYGEVRRALCTRDPRPLEPLLCARRSGLAAHVHGIRRPARDVSRTRDRSDQAPDPNPPKLAGGLRPGRNAPGALVWNRAFTYFGFFGPFRPKNASFVTKTERDPPPRAENSPFTTENIPLDATKSLRTPLTPPPLWQSLEKMT